MPLSLSSSQGAGDIDANLARGIALRAGYKATDMDADAEYDHDAGKKKA